MPRRMEGTSLILSGSSGIAAATARLAASEGARIAFCSRNEDRCRALAEELCSAGGEACYCTGDLTDAAAAERLAALCAERYGRIDAAYCAAGISARKLGDGPLHSCSEEGWDLAMRVNARGKFLMARAALRRMLEQPPDAASGLRGTVLFMASVQATAPDSLHFDTHGYAASKAAVVGLSQAVAAYYARDGIRSNAIAPAVTRTPLTQRAQASPELMAYLEQRQPLPRGILEADDVARASLFLLSGESRHITGQTLEVDGGWSSAR